MRRTDGAQSVVKGLATLHPAQTVVLTFVIFILSQILAGVLLLVSQQLAKAVGGNLGSIMTGSSVSQFLVILFVELLAVGGVWLVLRHTSASWRDIGFVRPQLTDMWMPVVAFIVYFVAFITLTAVLQAVLPGLDTGQRQDIGFTDAVGPLKLILVFLALVVLAPVAEEVLFRGLLFSALRKRLQFAGAALITSLLFGLAHIFGNEQGASLLWIAGIDTLILSLVLCYVREKTGRLWAPIILHAIKNSIAFLVLFVITECPQCGLAGLL